MDAVAIGGDPAPVPRHVAWVGAGDRRRGARAAGSEDLARAELAAIGALAAGACALGIGWLTVQVVSGALSLRPSVASALGADVDVEVLGEGADPGGRGGAWSTPAPRLQVRLADGGTGRSEIVRAVRALAEAGTTPQALDEEALARHLYAPDMPDPDLVVVSGGDRCVPALLVWEIAYSELVFLDASWPALDRSHLLAAVDEYQRRDRRYGGLVAPGPGVRR